MMLQTEHQDHILVKKFSALIKRDVKLISVLNIINLGDEFLRLINPILINKGLEFISKELNRFFLFFGNLKFKSYIQ